MKSADFVNVLARIVDSEQNFNGSADPMITAGRGFIQIIGPDFGFRLFGIRIVNLNVSPESSLSLSYVPMSCSGEND